MFGRLGFIPFCLTHFFPRLDRRRRPVALANTYVRAMLGRKYAIFERQAEFNAGLRGFYMPEQRLALRSTSGIILPAGNNSTLSSATKHFERVKHLPSRDPS